MRVAFLGLGRMGRAMAAHVPAGGHELTVWNRTPGHAADLVAAGAHEAASVADAVKDADAVVMITFDAEADRSVLSEVVAAAPAGTLVISATTVGQAAAREFAALAGAHGLRYVDAPVMGTVAPARAGTLGVFAGGTDADVTAARPLFELWGDPERIRHVGAAGDGNALKIVVNATLGVATAQLGECLRLGHEQGLDRTVVLDGLTGSPLGFLLAYKRGMIETGDYSDPSFTLDGFAKDLGIALASTHGTLPLTALAAELTEEAVGAGHGDDDYASLAGYLADEGHANSQ